MQIKYRFILSAATSEVAINQIPRIGTAVPGISFLQDAVENPINGGYPGVANIADTTSPFASLLGFKTRFSNTQTVNQTNFKAEATEVRTNQPTKISYSYWVNKTQVTGLDLETTTILRSNTPTTLIFQNVHTRLSALIDGGLGHTITETFTVSQLFIDCRMTYTFAYESGDWAQILVEITEIVWHITGGETWNYAFGFSAQQTKWTGLSVDFVNFQLVEDADIPIGIHVLEDIETNSVIKTVTPIYKDDLAKEYTVESDQIFFRNTLSGNLKFIGSDYDFIMSQVFETEFTLQVDKSIDNGSTWSTDTITLFYKTDCDIDEDMRQITVQVSEKDQYTEVLAGIDNEYDLIKLVPQKTLMTLQKRPLMQIYIPGSSTVACLLPGLSWEQDVTESTDTTSVIYGYHFGLCNVLLEINLTLAGATPTAPAGLYTGRLIFGYPYMQGDLFPVQTDLPYKLHVKYILVDSSNPVVNSVEISVIRTTDSVTLFFDNHSTASYGGGTDTYSDGSYTLSAAGGGATGTAIANLHPYVLYARFLMNVNKFEGNATYLIDTNNDIVDDNRNYKRVIKYEKELGYISRKFSATANEYGLSETGQYFAPPASDIKYFPLLRSSWRLSSLWIGFGYYIGSTYISNWNEYEVRSPHVVRDAVMLSSAIKALLGVIDARISHNNTDVYSEFLYGTTNPLTFNSFSLMLTQKTNILNSGYDKPAQKAPIKLSMILDMLRDTYQLYWYIDSNYRFIIEHISWFKNGGTYTPSPVYTSDITTLMNRKINKPWGYLSSKYDYDKEDLPERYEFSWADDVTEGFSGYPIEINSRFVKRGNIENIDVSDFTTDIDYMLLNPGAIDDDGFALFAAVTDNLFTSDGGYEEGYLGTDGLTFIADATKWVSVFIRVSAGLLYRRVNGNTAYEVYAYDIDKVPVAVNGTAVFWNILFENTYIPDKVFYIKVVFPSANLNTFRFESLTLSLPFIERNINGQIMELQNGLLSWLYLHPNYWIYDLPSLNVSINDAVFTTVQGVKRTKKQSVKYPSLNDPDPLKLIKTYLGDGQIEKISVNLSSRMNSIDLKYDTE